MEEKKYNNYYLNNTKMKNRKRRKLKKSFKRFLFIFLLALIVLILYFLNKERVIDLNNLWQDTKSIFVKNNNSENIVENTDNNDFVSIFKTRLPSKDLEFSSSSEILSNGDMKLFLNNTKDNSGYIYVNINDKADYVWITFVSVIDVEPLKTKIKNDLENLDYIDLRFSNKVFYKFKNANLNIVSNEKKSDEKSIKNTKNTNETASSSTIIENSSTTNIQ